MRLALLLAVFAFAHAGLSPALPEARAEVATVFATTGTPKLKKAGGASELELRAGSPLDAGDVVMTGEDSSAKLLLKDQSVIDVSPSTSFRIDALDDDGPGRDAELKADFGKVRASVNRKLSNKGKFLMRTPSTVMAVRGTEWVATSGAGKEEGKAQESVTVLAGKVAVSAVGSKEEPVVLERGYRMNVYLEFARQKAWDVLRKALGGEKSEAKRRHEVRTLSDAELLLLLRESRLEEHTIAQL